MQTKVAVRSSKAEEVYSYVKQQILSGAWKEGDRLNDSLLAEQIGVSRISVREALFRLVESGIVEKAYWKGYFIKEITDEIIADIVEVRIALESCAVRNLIRELTDAEVEKLRTIVDESEQLLYAGEQTLYLEKDYSFHETIYQSQHNKYIRSTLDNLQLAIHFVRYKSMGKDDTFYEVAANSIRWHRRILQAVENRDADSAVALLVQHLNEHQTEALAK